MHERRLRARSQLGGWLCAALLVCACGPSGARAEQGDLAGSLELVDPHALRVCADPRDLPFSDQAGEGFENKIADLFARKLGKNLTYTFYPGATGFVRKTLNAYRCDLVMGVPLGDDEVQPTNPYYRTSYAAVARKGSAFDRLDSIEDPRLRTAKIGIVAGTPPATYLAIDGLLAKIKSYPLVIDTRYDSSSQAMIDDLRNGTIDVALLWGPIAGYYASHSSAVPLAVTPLLKEHGGPELVYRVVMGVRHSDQDWKRQVNKLIAENRSEIDGILRSYGVPLLDENDPPQAR
ncbi:MAG: substrate-binding domain-containing protein [Hyphomicrobiales bacterium]|nr:substrate-binding domain-containing protein [Hyphomicrobiales bacterium]